MSQDKILESLKTDWKMIVEQEVSLPQQTLNVEPFKQLLRIEDGDVDVAVYLGRKVIARLEEEDGMWFPTAMGEKLISTFGFPTKEEALNSLVQWFQE